LEIDMWILWVVLWIFIGMLDYIIARWFVTKIECNRWTLRDRCLAILFACTGPLMFVGIVFVGIVTLCVWVHDYLDINWNKEVWW